MRPSMTLFKPQSVPPSATPHVTTKQQYFASCTPTEPTQVSFNTPMYGLHPHYPPKYWEPFHDSIQPVSPPVRTRLGKRWMEYQGVRDWAGLLDPLDDNLRAEILRYGNFVEASYQAFDFDPSSPSYGSCKYQKRSLLEECGFPSSGYRLTRNLRATSGIQLPRWAGAAQSSWTAMTQSSWIGYVAVCHDRAEIDRLGRRDVVIALRGTATCLEWLENLRATLAPIAGVTSDENVGPGNNRNGPMVEAGFLSLYTSRTSTCPSLQETLRREVHRIIDMYPDEPLSFTITGHSLGAALATLAAYDIKTTFERGPLVTVISFGGPRVGNGSFRSLVEKQGTKILRIVNPSDLITKLPGFVIDSCDDNLSSSSSSNNNNNNNNNNNSISIREEGHPMARFWTSWVQKGVEDAQWMYAEVGCELRLTSQEAENQPYYLRNMNFAECHDLKTYLKLVEGLSSKCPLRATAKRWLNKPSPASPSSSSY